MTDARKQFQTMAAQLRDLQDANKKGVEKLLSKAEGQGVDPAGLKRFVAWKRQNEEKRAQREAIDQQCRYLAGERETPAELPIGCELYRAVHYYRRNFTVRQVADEMEISTGKAGKLRELAQMFIVHVHESVDKQHDGDGVIIESNAAPQADEQPSPPQAADPAKPIPVSGARIGTLPSPDTWALIVSARDEHEAAEEAASQARLAEARRRKQEAIDEARRLRERNRQIDEDPLDFPAGFDRRPQVHA